MNNKILFAIIISGLATLAEAGGYSSSQTQETSGGYSSSQSNQPEKQVVWGNHKTQTTYVTTYKAHHMRGGAPHWVNASYGRTPKHAVSGGYERSGNPLYLCQARYHGGAHPGKIVGDNCNFGYGGAEIMTPIYQVLVSHQPIGWAAGDNGYIPANAISGGYENGHPLYVCQTKYEGGMHPGKVVGNRCNISYAGNEVSSTVYNVLVG